MKKSILVAALAALLSASAARAAQDAYPSLDAVPPPLMEGLAQQGQLEQKYVAAMAGRLRSHARETGALTLADIEATEARQKRDQSRSGLREAMNYDQNFDLKVTEDEIRETFEDKQAQRDDGVSKADRRKSIDQQVARIMSRYDTDKDGVVTAREAGTPPEKEPNPFQGRSGTSRDLLALDPDKDGTLTGAEVETLASKAFRTADKDADGAISREESAAVAKVVRINRLKSAGCTLPALAAQDKVVLIFALGGGAWSDVALNGEASETGAVRLEIEKGAEPLYIVLSSHKPVIWQVTGDTARIAKMVLAGPTAAAGMMLDGDVFRQQTGVTDIRAGVTGLAVDKVSYLKGERQGCLPAGFISQLYVGHIRRVQNPGSEGGSFKDLLGRDADAQYFGYAPVALSVGAAKVTALPTPDGTTPAPDGFDPEIWRQALILQPGGVAFFKDQAIVTESRPQAYKTLPGWAGLAQLVKQGALKAEKLPPPATRVLVTDGVSLRVVQNGGGAAITKNSDARIIVTDDWQFRILKDLEAFPAGLDGIFTTQFVLPKGVTLPDMKRRGASCIQPEEGAEVPQNTPLCN